MRASLAVVWAPPQWRNRRGGRGGRVPPRDFWPGNFCWRIGKKEARKKGKLRKKVENLKWKQKTLEKEVRTFFFFLLFTFENDENLFWVYQNGNFLPGKSISRREKKSGKMTLPPQKNMPVTPLPPPPPMLKIFLSLWIIKNTFCFFFTWLNLLASGLSFHATTHTIEVMAGHVRGKVAKYYERYFVHWFNDMVSWIFTPWKIPSWSRLKRAHYVSKPFDLLEIT